MLLTEKVSKTNGFLAALVLIRPSQWLKNAFVFAPLFFSGQITDVNHWKDACVIFLAFCMAASSVYCFNDLRDVEHDKLHPTKCHRPIASGQLSILAGYLLMALCLSLSFLIVFIFAGASKILVLLFLAFYVIINIAYTIKLKYFTLIDVFIIAFGFVLRVIVGGVGTNIELSQWIILMTFLLALFLAFAKRRDDVVIFYHTGISTRKKIDRYNFDFLNQTLTILATVTLVCYILYTVSDEIVNRFGSYYVFTTSIFVLAGILRYLQLTLVDSKSGNPTNILLHDRFVQFCVVGWVIAFVVIIYLKDI